MKVRATVNGTTVEREVDARRSLVDFLRDDLGLSGTSFGCEDGKCGACTVVVDGRAIKACMMLAVQLDGCEITTVEGLADGDTLHVLQQEFRANHALQCGFCTSGFLMSARALLDADRELTDNEVRRALVGNICRCTGYSNIVKAVVAASRRSRSEAEIVTAEEIHRSEDAALPTH
jgi:aerobic-type carbon monoxide dehydrogenase small subunit (CoxS/CutS family)